MRWDEKNSGHDVSYKVKNKVAATFKRRLENTLSMWANGKMGIHANQVVWVEDGKAFVIVWDGSCQHVSASGWIFGSGFCRPFSFLSHTKISFSFLENPKLQKNRHLNNSVFKLWIYKWFFWTLFCTFVKISSIFLFKKFLWILSQIW